MEAKTERLLKTAVTGLKVLVIPEALPNNFPCITFHFYSEDGVLFGFGTATEESAMCQVDIWYKVKTDEVKLAIKSIKQAIVKEKYFSYPSKETTYEINTKIYHTHFNFELLEMEE